MKMVMTLQLEWEVDNLEDYNARTLDEAVANQLMWINDGDVPLEDFAEFSSSTKLIDLHGEQ